MLEKITVLKGPALSTFTSPSAYKRVSPSAPTTLNVNLSFLISITWLKRCPSSLVFWTDHLPASIDRSSENAELLKATARQSTDTILRICFFIFVFLRLLVGSRKWITHISKSLWQSHASSTLCGS